jgi:cyanophycin synthetase
LLNPRVEAAVIENDSHTILNEGLAYDRCQIGIVIDATDAALDHPDLADPEANLRVFRTQVDVVLPSGAAILDAMDPIAVEMIALCDGEVLLYSVDAAARVLLEHLKRSGRAATVRDDLIVLLYGTHEVVLGPVTDFVASPQNVHALNRVIAIAASGWALGIAPAQLRGSLKTRVVQEFLV